MFLKLILASILKYINFKNRIVLFIEKKINPVRMKILTKAFGCDISLGKNVRIANKCNFFLQSGYTTKFDKAFFDGVICSDVIEHVQNPKALLQEIHRLLSPEGVSIISTPIRLTEQPIDKMHVFEWFESEFQEMIL